MIPIFKLVSNIRYKLVCAYCEDSDQSRHPLKLISLHFGMKNHWDLSYLVNTDQVVWIYAVHIYQAVPSTVSRVILCETFWSTFERK